MNKFWNWTNRTVKNASGEETEERVLELYGTIAEDSWFDDEISPKKFKDELNSGKGDISVWINSPGGDCIAAAQIYNMLFDYKGKVTVKIDGLAASAASVIAMAGDTVMMSPVAMMMIHNPATFAGGDWRDMQKAIDLLDSVKDSIINAYEIKTGMSRDELSKLMDAETWMDANKAKELGFIDEIIGDNQGGDNDSGDNSDGESTDEKCKKKKCSNSMLFSRKTTNKVLLNKLEKHYKKPEQEGVSANEIRNRLDLMKKFI